MAKRKRGTRPKQDEKPSEYEDKSASKLKINSYEDVADSEDEFALQRDKILLEEPTNKKSRRQREEDEFLQPSDEEVLGYSESSLDAEDEDVDEDEDIDMESDAPISGEEDEQGSEDEEEEEDEMAAWGGSRAAYYNTDKITNEEEALAEEEEARRLQQKRLKSLREADFMFDEGEWAAGGDDEEDNDDQETGVVKETLPQLQITPDMNDMDKLKVLRRRYPDFEAFAKELVNLQPQWEQLKQQVDTLPQKHLNSSTPATPSRVPAPLTQFRALSAYVAALSMYFALLTSPARDNAANSHPLPLPPQEIRAHELYAYITECRSAWKKVLNLSDPPNTPSRSSSSDERPTKPTSSLPPEPPPQTHLSPQPPAPTSSRRAAALARTHASLANLDASLAQPTPTPISTSRSQHDIADDPPDAATLSANAQKKKSLRFYTSRIAQQAHKDERPGGDDDLPYRERWRERMERLNAAAEARGREGRDVGLEEDSQEGGEQEEEGQGGDRQEGNEEQGHDADYEQLTANARDKKRRKAEREAAYATARGSGGRVVQAEQEGADGRREVGWVIERNKGLTPKRKKENRNPRVKKRRRYEDRSKKLRSMKAVWKGGEAKGGYQGEETGIKAGLVRSVRF